MLQSEFFLQNVGKVGKVGLRCCAQRRRVQSEEDSRVERHLDHLQAVGIGNLLNLSVLHLSGCFLSHLVHVVTDDGTSA